MDVVLGRIVGVFGIKGSVKVYSETRPREQILKYSPWQLKKPGASMEMQVSGGGPRGKGLIAQLRGIDDRNAAEALVGMEISIPADRMPAAEAGEYYWSQLEGLDVVNREGIGLGRVDYLFETGANDVMVLRGERQRLIPFTADAVLDVDLEHGVIRVDWDPEF